MRSKLGVITAAVFAVLAAFVAKPAPAAAWFEVCNHAGEQITVAVVDTWVGDDGDDYLYSRGWWNVDQGNCVTAISDSIEYDVVYLYAYSTNHSWSGSEYYCVDTQNAFWFHGDRADTDCPTSTTRGFLRIDTGDYTNYTDTLTAE